MKLRSLSLQCFRQHADTTIRFQDGLTGIIGTNGSGKSTILEAIAFAIYGVSAARGKRDSIKSQSAAPRAAVRVELEFELAGHRYRVVRGLSTAECYLDGASTPMANTVTGVTECLERQLGMTRAEFFATYFTGQKELAALAALSPADRARFLSRVLGYDRVELAQGAVRDRRRDLMSQSVGLASAMADRDAVAQMIADAQARVTAAAAAIASAREASEKAERNLALAGPHWRQAQQRRERSAELSSQLASVEAQLEGHARDRRRLEAELASIVAAEREQEALAVEVQPLADLRRELQAMDERADLHAKREKLVGVEQTSVARLSEIDARIAVLAADVASITEKQLRTEVLGRELETAEAAATQARDQWTAATADAKARRTTLRDRHVALTEQLATLQQLGPESACASCGQALGDRYAGVCSDLASAIETTRAEGTAAKVLVADLSTAPAALTVAQTARSDAHAALVKAQRELSDTMAAQREHERLSMERTSLVERLETVRASLETLASGYDAARHATLRAEVSRLSTLDMRLAVVNSTLTRKDAAHEALEQVTTDLRAGERQVATLADELRAQGITGEQFATVRAAFDDAERMARAASDALTATLHEQRTADEALGFAHSRQAELAAQIERLTMLDLDRRMHEEMDRALGGLRTALNDSVRPELAEIAGDYLHVLTDGRYQHAEFDEAYQLVVHEDGLAKPVISGGEEDLCNLILRLAVAQMIALRSGHAFSLLVLDEVFGALDESRRANVLALLRRLKDRFSQVIVISHIDAVRDGFDHVIRVAYDRESGTSVVTADDADATRTRIATALAHAA